MRQVVAQADGSVAAGVFGCSAARFIPAAGATCWQHTGVTAQERLRDGPARERCRTTEPQKHRTTETPEQWTVGVLFGNSSFTVQRPTAAGVLSSSSSPSSSSEVADVVPPSSEAGEHA